MSLPPALRISEEAQDLICRHISNLPDKRARLPALSAFTRTARSWLLSSLRALYRSPLDAPSFSRDAVPATTWASAASLLSTLRARPGLASHVEYLQPLTNIYRRLCKSACPWYPRIDMETGMELNPPSRYVAWECACEISKCCPRLRDVGMPMATEQQAKAMVKALVVAPDRLVGVAIAAKGLSKKAFHLWLTRAGITRLDRLVLSNICWSESTESSTATRGGLPIRVRKLSLLTCDLDLANLLLCLPKRTSNLHSFTMTAHDLPSPAKLDILVQALGRQLRTFSFDGLGTIDEAPWEYEGDHSGPTIPLSLFTSFPTLRHFTLRYTRRMTLDKLEALATSSPAIVTIDFGETAWDVPDYFSCDERIAAVISSLGALTSLDLGWVLAESLWKSWRAARDKKVAIEFVLLEEDPEEYDVDTDMDMEDYDSGEYPDSGEYSAEEWLASLTSF